MTGCQSTSDASGDRGLPAARAIEALRARPSPITTVERVPVRAALGRVLAQDLVSPIDVPAFDNSAMDGYAFDGACLDAGVRGLRLRGVAFAGRPFTEAVEHGECVQVMTGAVMPRGCDTVVPRESCRVDAGMMTFEAGIRRGENRRLRGEDLRAGSVAIPAGRILRPAELGLAASLGFGELGVWRRLRVAFFSTGDELRSIGEPLAPGEVYDSNRYTLLGMITRLGMDAIDLGVVRDEPAALEQALRSAAESADVVITSGGVSAGDADYVRDVMAGIGDVEFWRIAMRPGRPMAYGHVRSTSGRSATLFGLPGNPVAVMVTFYQFVREALLHLQRANPDPLPIFKVRCLDALRKRPGRTEYLRGILGTDEAGQAVVRSFRTQGSGVLRSMSEGNCFIVLGHDEGSVEIGGLVSVLPFAGLA
ncbi:MAG TPA: gephyrin-like molybdotransferase Glp [Burkholderiaceae bacterium]|nr:gephyrin-like molybdotransferase Glp [Burkholderiaceae bacterium]